MGNIYLSREKGLNPALAICPQCGKENGEIVLAGDAKKYQCPECKGVVIASPMHRRGLVCPRCGFSEKAYSGYFERLGEFDGSTERAASSLCADCQKDQDARDAACRAEVERGGILWRCRDCGSTGAIKAEHPLCKDVRARLNVPAPKPCGVEFDRAHHCPVCAGAAKH